jgi:hypothetical protein
MTTNQAIKNVSNYAKRTGMDMAIDAFEALPFDKAMEVCKKKRDEWNEEQKALDAELPVVEAPQPL